MKRQTAQKTVPVTQKVKMIVSSMPPQFDAISVHHQGVQKWKAIEPIITKAKAADTARWGYFAATNIPITANTKTTAMVMIIFLYPYILNI